MKSSKISGNSYVKRRIQQFAGVLGALLLAGCATIEKGAYHPRSGKEKQAFARANRDVTPSAVKKDFQTLKNSELAWAGVIKDVQYKETERTIQVAFEVDHRHFDWKDYGGGEPYRLSIEGDGIFIVGWVVDKPTRISYLKSLAKPGDMLIAYGKPYRMTDGVVQLAATAVRPVSSGDYVVE